MKIKAASFALLSALYVCVGCGPSKQEAEHPAEDHAAHEHAEHGGDGEGHGDHDGHGKHEHEMTGAIKAFHDMLAPVYHDPKGAARDDKACGAVASFKDGAKGIGAEAKSDGQKKNAEGVVAAVADLETACGVKGHPEVDAKLEKLHEAFHAAMEGH